MHDCIIGCVNKTEERTSHWTIQANDEHMNQTARMDGEMDELLLQVTVTNAAAQTQYESNAHHTHTHTNGNEFETASGWALTSAQKQHRVRSLTSQYQERANTGTRFVEWITIAAHYQCMKFITKRFVRGSVARWRCPSFVNRTDEK